VRFLDWGCDYATVSIAEGAFFKGLIGIRTPGQGNDGMVTPGISTANSSGAAIAVQA